MTASEGSGSAVEPTPQHAPQADSEMRAATERLRDKAWMVAPMTTAIPDVAGDHAGIAPLNEV